MQIIFREVRNNDIQRQYQQALPGERNELNHTYKRMSINKGQIPTEEQLLALSRALNCSVMDFFEDEEKDAPTVDYVYQNEDEQILIEGYRNMPKSQQYKLMAYYYALMEGKE